MGAPRRARIRRSPQARRPWASRDGCSDPVRLSRSLTRRRPGGLTAGSLHRRPTPGAEASSRRPGAARSRRRPGATCERTGAWLANIAPGRRHDSPQGGRRDGAHPYTSPDRSRPTRPGHLGDLPPGEGDLFCVKADVLVRPVASWAVPAGRRTGLCHPVRTGAGRGGALLVPPARHLILTTLGLVWHPVDLATPDRAAARGQPSTLPAADVVQLCPRDVVW